MASTIPQMASITPNSPPVEFRHQDLRFRGPASAGFMVGAFFGLPYHLIKGIIKSPNGNRFTGGLQAMRTNGPRAACTAAALYLISDVTDITVCNLRQKVDVLNPLISVSATAGLFKIRSGLITASKWAITAPILYALCLEGTKPIQKDIAAAQKKVAAARRLRAERKVASAEGKVTPARLRAETKVADARLRAERKVPPAKLRAERNVADAKLRAERNVADARLRVERKVTLARLRAERKVDAARLRAEAATKVANSETPTKELNQEPQKEH